MGSNGTQYRLKSLSLSKLGYDTLNLKIVRGTVHFWKSSLYQFLKYIKFDSDKIHKNKFQLLTNDRRRLFKSITNDNIIWHTTTSQGSHHIKILKFQGHIVILFGVDGPYTTTERWIWSVRWQQVEVGRFDNTILSEDVTSTI